MMGCVMNMEVCNLVPGDWISLDEHRPAIDMLVETPFFEFVLSVVLILVKDQPKWMEVQSGILLDYEFVARWRMIDPSYLKAIEVGTIRRNEHGL
jgi:hypothetical protein